jgi:large subunit ribosomal protein L4
MFARRVSKLVQVAVHNISGEVIDHIDLSDEVFGIPMNSAVVRQSLLRQQANARQGTVETKRRGEVSGGGKKPYRQKGTGRARRGSSRSPLLRGGGVVFGPHPRSHNQAIPKKVRRLALRCILSSKIAENEMLVIDALAYDKPDTKGMAKIVDALKLGKSLLIVTDEPDANVYKSARNIEGADVLPAYMLNAKDMLSHRKMLITVKAAKKVDELCKPVARKTAKV